MFFLKEPSPNALILTPMAISKAPSYPQGESGTLTAALRKILKVSHADMHERFTQEQKAQKSKVSTICPPQRKHETTL
jgi:hypothetical protein